MTSMRNDVALCAVLPNACILGRGRNVEGCQVLLVSRHRATCWAKTATAPSREPLTS